MSKVNNPGLTSHFFDRFAGFLIVFNRTISKLLKSSSFYHLTYFSPFKTKKMKKIIVRFEFPKGTQKQYDAVWDDLKAKGYEHPQGLLFHTGAPMANGNWFVCDLWESEQAFNEFGKILMPIIEKQKFQDAKPEIMPAHFVYQNVYQTQREGVLS